MLRHCIAVGFMAIGMTPLASLLPRVRVPVALSPTAMQGASRVQGQQKISDLEGGFDGVLDNGDDFGLSVAPLGDLDWDGVEDMAVGAANDDDGGNSRGATWILFMNADGTIKFHQKISDTEGGFGGVLQNSDGFGLSVACLGDLDSDGVVDLAVGARGDDDGGTPPAERGAIWILFLNSDGTVRAHQKISDTQGGFTGVLNDRDWFGSSVAALGDHDGDGVADVAVGAMGDFEGATFHEQIGAVWILFLNQDGTVKSHQKINEVQGGFTGDLWDFANFGSSVASLEDLDSDGVGDLAVGAVLDGEFASCDFPGSVWILFLNADGTVKAHQKITSQEGGFDETLILGEFFGSSLGFLGDLDGDGLEELAVGAGGDPDGGTARGAVWMLSLAANGMVARHWKISDTAGGFRGVLDDEDYFGGFFLGGGCVALLGDLDGDGFSELGVGAPMDDDGGSNRGAVWVLSIGRGKLERFTGPVIPGGSVSLPLTAGPRIGDGPGVPRRLLLVIVGTGSSRSSILRSHSGWHGDFLLDPGSIVGLYSVSALGDGWAPRPEHELPHHEAAGGTSALVQACILEERGAGVAARLILLPVTWGLADMGGSIDRRLP